MEKVVVLRRNINHIIEFIIMVELAGIKVMRSEAGAAKFVTIDLSKHADIIPFLEQKGIEIEQPIKWTAKMKRSFEQAKNGEWTKGDINNFWNV